MKAGPHEPARGCPASDGALVQRDRVRYNSGPLSRERLTAQRLNEATNMTKPGPAQNPRAYRRPAAAGSTAPWAEVDAALARCVAGTHSAADARLVLSFISRRGRCDVSLKGCRSERKPRGRLEVPRLQSRRPPHGVRAWRPASTRCDGHRDPSRHHSQPRGRRRVASARSRETKSEFVRHGQMPGAVETEGRSAARSKHHPTPT